MRSATAPLLVTLFFVIAVVAIAAYHRHSIHVGSRHMADRLHQTNIDLVCEKMPLQEAITLLQERLCEKDTWFEGCRFEVDPALPPQ